MNQALCVTALFGLGARVEGSARIWLVAAAALGERDGPIGGALRQRYTGAGLAALGR